MADAAAKREARDKREAAAADAAAREQRSRRIKVLGGALAAAIVLVVAIAALAHPSRDTSATGALEGTAETRELLAGIPQNGLTLGSPDAPATIVEFVDLQCPVCRAHQLDAQKGVIDEWVRPGKARLTLVPLAFLGEDSVAGRAVMARLAARDHAWAFANLFYWNEGDEGTGYATDAWLRRLAVAAGGTAADAVPRTASGEAQALLARGDELAKTLLGNPQTPTFAVGRTSAAPATYRVLDTPDYRDAPAALDRALPALVKD